MPHLQYCMQYYEFHTPAHRHSPTISNQNWAYSDEYPHGFAQPAIVAYFKVRLYFKISTPDGRHWKHGAQALPLTYQICRTSLPLCLQEKPVFRWTLKPSKENLDGAADRPVPADLYEVLRTIVQGKSLESMQMHVYDSHELKKTQPRLYQSKAMALKPQLCSSVEQLSSLNKTSQRP